MSSLHLLLPASAPTDQTAFAHALTSDGRSVVRHGTAAAALLPAASGAGSETVAVVPAERLSWHQVTLPQGTGPRSPRLRAVLEGLLEERLLDDPEQLHLALGPAADADGRHWVAACDRPWLRACLQQLEAAGRPVSRVVPEFAPEGDPVLVATGDPEQARLACASREGVLTLPLVASARSLLPGLPADTPVVAEPAVAALAEQWLGGTPRLQQPAERLLASAATGWDLAQFEFSRSGRALLAKRASSAWAQAWRAPQWRAARWALGVLLAAQVVGLNAWAWKERSALAAKREATRTVLTQTFPAIRAVVDPMVQMEREVAGLRQRTGASSGRDLETLLGALAVTAPAGRAASGLEYTGTDLRVRGVASTAAEAQAIDQALRPLGYAAAIQGDVLIVRQELQP